MKKILNNHNKMKPEHIRILKILASYLSVFLVIWLIIFLLWPANAEKKYSKYDCNEFKESYREGYRIGSICEPSTENHNCDCDNFLEIERHNNDDCFCQGFYDGRHHQSKYPEKDSE